MIQIHTGKELSLNGTAMNIVSESLRNIETIKAYGLDNRFIRLFDDQIKKSIVYGRKKEKRVAIMTGAKTVSRIIQISGLFLGGLYLLNLGEINAGQMVTFVLLSSYISAFVDQIDNMFRQLRKAEGTLERVLGIQEIQQESKIGEVSHIQESICFQNVSFAYPGRTEKALQQVNITLPQGMTHIVGESGSGKSTLAKLICAFYSDYSGNILLGNLEQKSWDRKGLRSNIALVSQESYLISGTIYENIAFGRPEITREECESLLEELGLIDAVRAFPLGIDQSVGEIGDRLSGGQKQRICIARALAKQAKILILDEASSALDYESEQYVQAAINRRAGNTIIINITHRIHQTVGAKHIYVLYNGRIAESGSSQHLYHKKELYYSFCQEQGVILDEK